MSTTIDKMELMAQYSQLPLDSKYMRLVAHDVRNQMNTIMMATDMLREALQERPGNEERYVNMISHASEDVLTILEAAVTVLTKRDHTANKEDS